MKAKFISRIMFHGVEVHMYLDLETEDFVWLEGGRNGKEMRRIPKPVITYRPGGRAVDIPARLASSKYVQTGLGYPMIPNEDKLNYIHWAY